MDDNTARNYVASELRKRGNPPNIDPDDLVQEFLLAELQNVSPTKRIAEILEQSAREARRTIPHSNPNNLPDDHDSDCGDEEWAEYLDLEREITEETRDVLWQRLATALEKLPDYVQGEMEALRIFFGFESVKAGSYKRLAKAMSVTRPQAEHLVKAGLARLKALAIPELVKLQLFPTLVDEVYRVPESYRRGKGHFVRKEKDLWKGDVA